MDVSNEALIERIQAGVDVADNLTKLWKQNKGAIWQQAKKYSGYADMDDLMQEGYLILHKAVYDYDTSYGAPFISLLYSYLPRMLYRYIGQQEAMRLPEGARRQIGELDRIENLFQIEHGRRPTDREICCLLHVSPDQLARIKKNRKISSVDSLDRPLEQEEGETFLGDCVADPDSAMIDVEEKIFLDSLKSAVWDAVDSLEPDQADVIRRRYAEGQTYKEVSQSRGKESPEYARQWEAKALRRLRQGRRYKVLLPYWEEMDGAEGMKGVGVKRFNNTWTSATEREALRMC